MTLRNPASSPALLVPFLLLLVLFALLSPLSTTNVAALPTGAPRCKINVTVITMGHEIGMAQLGFSIVAPATYTPGAAAPLAIQVAGLSNFARGGILTYVKQVNNPNAATGFSETHVGKFDIATNGLRPQTVPSCQLGTVMNEAPESTVTHAAPVPATNIQTLMWTPPAADAGPVQVNMVISTGSEETPTRSKPATATPTPAPAPAPAPVTAPAPVGGDFEADDFAAAGVVAPAAAAGAGTGASAVDVAAQIAATVADVQTKIAAAQALVKNAQMLALVDAAYVVAATDPSYDALMAKLNAAAAAVAAL
ncbi:hypothetical protein DFJ73DRAFT_962888 [Zopfochytrium polystomum]|nr:hypothetical protein DFJ73DRAFT_962888 [Zopfochytrium polystomum]